MSKKLNLTGQKFNRLTALTPTWHMGRAAWNCTCLCGGECVVITSNLRSGNTKSCGCLHRERVLAAVTRHGCNRKRKPTSEYMAWAGMKARCLNSKNSQYKNYGGRGIKVCDRWLNSFENFLEDMGEKPSRELSIERINNNGNYEPGNCKWATQLEQASNTRKLKYFRAVNKKTGKIHEGNSQRFFVEKYKLDAGNVSACLHGKRRQAGGWLLTYTETKYNGTI